MNFKKAIIFVMALTILSIAAAGNLRAGNEGGAPCPKKVAVVLETVKAADFIEYQYFTAIGQPEIVAVKSPVGGILSELKVSEGSLVDAGQELAVLNAGASEEVKALEAAAVKAKKVLTARQGWKDKSEKAIASAAAAYQKALDALNAKKAQANLVVKAPVAGIVHLVMAAGSEMAAEALLMEIADPRQFIFLSPVTAADKGALAVGDTFSGMAEGVDEIEAKLIAIDDSQVALRANNEANQVKEGARYTFKKLKAEYAAVIVIPSAAVQTDSLGDYVYGVEKKRAKKTYVTIGARDAGRSMVEKGLFAGSPLIVSGLECLVDGKKVRITNEDELSKARAAAQAREKAKAEAEFKAQADAEQKAREAAREAKKPAEPEVKPEAPVKAAKSVVVDKSRFRAGLVFGRFSINDKNMRAFYGDWFQNIPGIEVAVHTIKSVDVWASYKMFNNERTTTYFNDPVKFKLSPLSVGLRYRLPKWRIVEPFFGAGLNFYSYKETIGSESELEDSKGSATGFHFQGGAYFSNNTLRFLLGEIFVKYNLVTKTLAETLPDGTDEVDFGGLEVGVGLVVKF